MACEVPCMSYVALYVISMHIVNSNSRSSSHHWKLNLSAGKVEQASLGESSQDHHNSSSNHNNTTGSDGKKTSQKSSDSGDMENPDDKGIASQELPAEDRMMDILMNKVAVNGEWIVMSPGSDNDKYFGVNKEHLLDQFQKSNSQSQDSECKENSCSQKGLEKKKASKKKQKPLTCGKKVNSTIYDHLRGLSERSSHSNIPEPDVAMIFKSNGKNSEVDMKELEDKLRLAKTNIEKAGNSQREQAAQVYNLIGNFWRIKGNTQIAVECFRKALHISPEDPDILLNLARVLFNLQYLDDAIFLARRSLHLQPAGENSWLQHYTLGEILKSYGHMEEAATHFHQTLELNPGFAPAKSQLREIASGSAETIGSQPSVTHFTLFIILFLVVGVLFGVVTSIETGFQDSSSMGVDGTGKLQPRHFNRAMAMRSIKLGINPRLCRLRRAANS